MLAELFTWWAQQMREMLPRRWTAGSRFADALVLRSDGAALTAVQRRRGVETRLGPVVSAGARLRARPGGAVLLALPDSALLRLPASLPLAAERDLAAVLRHEMDRLTPFRADDLFWTWRVEARDRAAGRIKLLLLLVPKRAAAAALASLEQLGLSAKALEIGGAGRVEHLPLTQPGAASDGRRSVRLAAGVCAALLLALCGTPILRQQIAVARAEARVDALRPQIALRDALRRRIEANASGADLFAAESRRVGSPLRALAAATAALPDDSYLTAFAMRERRLSLTGRSGAAVKLIALLSADPDLRDPAFDAPVTRVGERSDLFSIRATLAP